MKVIYLSVLTMMFLTACGEPLTLEQVRAKEEWCISNGGKPKYLGTLHKINYPYTVNCEIEGLMYGTDHIQ